MPRRLLFALLILVSAPLVLLGWVSAASMRQQRRIAEQRLQGILTARLLEIDRILADVLESHTRRLAAKLDAPGKITDKLRDLEWNDPLIRKGILVSQSGVLVHPLEPTADDPDDITLFAAIRALIHGRIETAGTDESGTPPAPPSTGTITIRGEPYWQLWYMDEGSQLILWFSRTDGSSVGLLLERVRWLSDLTAALPDSDLIRGRDVPTVNFDATDVNANGEPSLGANAAPGFTALVDESRQVIYRWGDEGELSGKPLAVTPLSSPLGGWRLEFFSSAAIVPPTSSAGLYASLTGIAIVLLALGAFVLTSVGRQMSAARNRVSFAGQVSHELRTPLTNIRLYAELAAEDLRQFPGGEPTEKLGSRLSVIDSESRRLSRLVSGVLEMVRDDRNQRGPRLATTRPDEIIDQTLDQFAPSFQKAGLRVDRDGNASTEVRLDPDILEMVLVNLLSNVEKYASQGGGVTIESSLDAQQLKVVVQDAGPGIPRHRHRSVFRPFTRLDDSINAPSGTGIGLTIARNAARRHGGDLRLVPSDQGARFELTLPLTA